MTTNLRISRKRSVTPLLGKTLAAVLLAAGLTTTLQPATADARGFGSGGGVGGHGWEGHGWGHGYGWGGVYWGWPAWSFYAPVYAWGPSYPYYYDPYYYGPPAVASVASFPAYDADALPESARTYHQQAYVEALSAPLGQTIAWSGGGVSGTVTAVRDGHSGSRYCREFLQKVVIDGRNEQAHGAACQTPDGGWQVVPDNP